MKDALCRVRPAIDELPRRVAWALAHAVGRAHFDGSRAAQLDPVLRVQLESKAKQHSGERHAERGGRSQAGTDGEVLTAHGETDPRGRPTMPTVEQLGEQGVAEEEQRDQCGSIGAWQRLLARECRSEGGRSLGARRRWATPVQPWARCRKSSLASVVFVAPSVNAACREMANPKPKSRSPIMVTSP